ncbi:malate/lactate/ureidoglycolate dehydrogenase [Microvirga roseola]|uniref:malate/lactate/ureidoglycolate dehydrogenase n=1 Tax=Microvirga roseola TaxID=2883126 RepID=UPI001E2C2DAE|nr:malate/lactate/ureidoglycolate dehydrogenase [Microvirga roseola]
MSNYVSAHPHRLALATVAVFRGIGSSETEARLIADNLVLANLTGHDSHGVGLVPLYLEGVRAGIVQVNQKPELVADADVMLALDGRMGFGQVIGHEAMELGIRRVHEHGICLVATRNSHHLSRIGHWGEQCARTGYVSTQYVNTLGLPPLVAPYGGSDARVATNPYCAAVPSPDGHPVVLDMATSKIALGKARVAMNKGVAVEDDTLIDADGEPTNDPSVMYQDPIGAILPFGGHKGYGLGIIAELLAGALSGGGTYNAGTVITKVIHNNMLSIIFDPGRLGGTHWRKDISRFIDWVKASPLGRSAEGVLMAGEPERIAHRACGTLEERNSYRRSILGGNQRGRPRRRRLSGRPGGCPDRMILLFPQHARARQ